MTWLYVVLVAVVVAGFVGMLWLKRAGDRAWRMHNRCERVRSILVRLVADTSGFERAMRRAAAQLDELGRAWRAEDEGEDCA